MHNNLRRFCFGHCSRLIVHQHIVFNREQNRSLKEWSRSEGLTEKYWLKYVGEIRNGLPNGTGTKFWPSGAKYEGNFKVGKYNGQGTYT